MPGLVGPFGTTPPEPLISEESNVVEGQVERRQTSVSKKKQKKKKVSFSLGGLASDRHVNTLGHFDQVDPFLSATEAAVTLSRDQPVETPQYIGNWMSMYEVIPYDS